MTDGIKDALSFLAKYKGFPEKLPANVRCDESGGTTYGRAPVSIDASMADADGIRHALALGAELGQGHAAILISIPDGIVVAVGGRILAVENNSLRFMTPRQNGTLACDC